MTQRPEKEEGPATAVSEHSWAVSAVDDDIRCLRCGAASTATQVTTKRYFWTVEPNGSIRMIGTCDEELAVKVLGS